MVAFGLALLLTSMPPTREVELSVGGFDRTITSRDPRVDCSRGLNGCRLLVRTIGPFAISRGEAQFEGGSIVAFRVRIEASVHAVAAWLGEAQGAVGQPKEGGGIAWRTGTLSGIEIWPTGRTTQMVVTFRADIPWQIAGCRDEDWFEIRPSRIAAREVDGSRC